MKLVFHTSEDGSEIQIVHHDESITRLNYQMTQMILFSQVR